MADFYCDEVLNGKMPVSKVTETENVLAYHHTRPSYEVHIVVIPKKHIASLTALDKADNCLLLEMMEVIKSIAVEVTENHGACKIITNLGSYQDSKHLHFHIVYGERIK